MKREAVVHAAESTGVNWDCLGHAGPYDHPSRGHCVCASDIEEGFIKCGEEAKEYRSSFNKYQGNAGELISSSECSFLFTVRFFFFPLDKKCDVVEKLGDLAMGRPSSIPCLLCGSLINFSLSFFLL